MSQINNMASLGKRLLAIFYDILILFFLTLVVTLIIQQIFIQFALVPLESVQISATETIKMIPSDSIANYFLKSLWLITSFTYFYYYWTKRGQTPGMKVWKIKLESMDKSSITTLQVIKRYIFAFMGIGIVWILVDKDKFALQDRISQTIINTISTKQDN